MVRRVWTCPTTQLTLRAASKHWLVEFYEAGGLTALVMNLSDVEVIEDKTDKDVQVTGILHYTTLLFYFEG